MAILKPCEACGKEMRLRFTNEKRYCNNQCQNDNYYFVFIKAWKAGELDAKVCYRATDGSVSGHIRRYMLERAGNKCERCNWNQLNPFTQKVPLEIEHIDGNCTNTLETNLIVLCPNCHSLTATYKGANKGSGRKARLGKDNRLIIDLTDATLAERSNAAHL